MKNHHQKLKSLPTRHLNVPNRPVISLSGHAFNRSGVVSRSRHDFGPFESWAEIVVCFLEGAWGIFGFGRRFLRNLGFWELEI